MATTTKDSANPGPATTVAGLRVALVFAAGIAASHGLIERDSIDGTVEVILQVAGAGAAAYGLFKTWDRQRRIKRAERALGRSAKTLG